MVHSGPLYYFRTTKRASNSSTDQSGGEPRSVTATAPNYDSSLAGKGNAQWQSTPSEISRKYGNTPIRTLCAAASDGINAAGSGVRSLTNPCEQVRQLFAFVGLHTYSSIIGNVEGYQELGTHYANASKKEKRSTWRFSVSQNALPR
jgi:hypothetical protein